MSPVLQPQSTSLDPQNAYDKCVSEGKLSNDEGQRLVIARLHELYQALLSGSKRTLLGKILSFGAKAAPRSIYIWGDVGRGKSLLMDMFYAAAPVAKKRIHFHSFMQDVHAQAHAVRKELESYNSRKDLMVEVAQDIAQSSGQLICLDELQVSDVADAMILSRLFGEWLSSGITFVITSNRPPEELYLGGLQREKFMSFVDLVYGRMDVLELASPHDYRMQQIRAMQAVYIWPISPIATASLDKLFGELTHHCELAPLTLEVLGRTLSVPQSYGGIARFSFADLCEKPLGAADYLAIARRFHTVFITDIPMLTPEKRNEAKRFVTLIDTLYDHRVKLVCTAATAPTALYAEGDGRFEFARTVSRLAEMQSAQYLATPHIP